MFYRYVIVIFLTFTVIGCGTAVTPASNNDVATSTVVRDKPTSSEATSVGTSNQDVLLTTETLDRIRPEDVIQEIGYFGGLGGGEEGACWNQTSPIISGYPETATELMQQIVISACGLPLGEEVVVTLEMPNGEERQSRISPEQTESQARGHIIYEYVPLPQEPTGLYKFIFTGKDWSLEYPHLINSPSRARLYLYESKLYFLNFSPNERIRLLVYLLKNPELLGHVEFKEFYGWAQYQVDENGELQIRTDIEHAEYVAVGEVTGVVNHRLPNDYAELEWFSVYCPGAPNPIGIRPESYAEILVESLPAYRYDFSNGSWLSEGDISLGKGTVVKIVSNPLCKDRMYLWQIQCMNNQSCYVYIPEASPEGSYLRPIEYIPPTSSPVAPQIPACPGTKATRLQVGMNAEVTTSGMAPQLSLREQPSMDAGQAHVIAAGRDMVILEGPVCADGSYWWHIRSEQGFEGWAREADNEDYWIDPLP